MTHRSSNINARPAHSDERRLVVVLCAFTTAFLWWIGIVGVVNSGGGAQVFLAIPALATIGTVLVGHRRGRHLPMHIDVKRRRRSRNSAPSGAGYPVVILCGFTTALLWWIGIVGVVNSGGGAQVFLMIPFLSTIGTLLTALRYRHRGIWGLRR